MKRIVVLFGVAGSGKSTLAQILAKNYNYHYVSPSNILQNIADECETVGSDIVRESLKTGILMPDTLFNKLIANYFNKRKTNKIVFDGYPRTWASADEFEKLIQSSGFNSEDIYIIFVQATKKEALKRYLQRNRISPHFSPDIRCIGYQLVI